MNNYEHVLHADYLISHFVAVYNVTIFTEVSLCFTQIPAPTPIDTYNSLVTIMLYHDDAWNYHLFPGKDQ